jgi:para-aminobenzoate synthetase component 1
VSRDTLGVQPSSRFLLAVLDCLPRDADLAVMRDGPRWIVGVEPDEVVTARGAEAFVLLDDFAEPWWAGFVSYDLGRSIEPHRPWSLDDLGLPHVAFARFGARLTIGMRGFRIEGDGRARRVLEQATRRARDRGPARCPPPELWQWTSSLTRAEFEDGVRSIQRLIVAGECYQVNLTRRLTCDESADTLRLFAELLRVNPAPYAALLRLEGTSVVSASPERFLRRDGPKVVTRPIKGTGRDRARLAVSPKDRAENVMIVDLARNDLGRVCEYGSVRVPALWEVEAHPGLYHLVSTVEGSLRREVSAGDLIRATFPAASVTGAPKPRVLEIIEALEPCRRGVYCGAIGWIDPVKGILDFSVAIRTFLVKDGQTHLGVGAGIVADSVPENEWQETELKVARLLAAAGRPANTQGARGRKRYAMRYGDRDARQALQIPSAEARRRGGSL